MKRFTLLIIALVLCSSACAGVEEARDFHRQSLSPDHKNPYEQINPISSPFDATLIIPQQHPTVAGSQNRYDPDRNLKLFYSTFSELYYGTHWSPRYKDSWEIKYNASVFRFILFRNLRL